MNFKHHILLTFLLPLALFPILVFAGGGEQVLSLFSFVNWDEIISHIIKFTIVVVILVLVALREIKNWPEIEKIKWIKYRPHKNISYQDMVKHINDKMITNKDLPENIAELAVKGFKKTDEFQKEYLKSRELISEKAFFVLFIIVGLIVFSLLAFIKISPDYSSFFMAGVLNSALTKFIIALFSVLLPIIIFTTMFSIWRKYGRDIKMGTIVPQYKPPKGITPTIADYIYHKKTSSRSFPSVILDMAIEGFIKMENVYEQREKIDVVKFPKSIAVVIFLFTTLIVFAFCEIKCFLVYLFLVVPSIIFIFLFAKKKIDELYNPNFSEDVELTYNKHNLTNEKLYPLAALIIYILFKDKKLVRKKELKIENDFGGRSFSFQFDKGLTEIKRYLKVIPSHFYSEHYKSLKAYKIIGAFSICVFFLFLFLFLFGLPLFPNNLVGVLAWYLNLIFTNGLFLSLFISFAIFMIFDCFMPSRTKEGTKIYRHLLGFKMYLEKAEKFRVKECVPETFEKYLPYAVIFGIEKKWRNRFSGIINVEEKQGY